MKPVPRAILIGSLAYLAGGLATLGYVISQGISTGTAFDGITGTEPPAIKALEVVLAWPYVLATTIAGK